jgi:hypothetical protein
MPDGEEMCGLRKMDVDYSPSAPSPGRRVARQGRVEDREPPIVRRHVNRSCKACEERSSEVRDTVRDGVIEGVDEIRSELNRQREEDAATGVTSDDDDEGISNALDKVSRGHRRTTSVRVNQGDLPKN